MKFLLRILAVVILASCTAIPVRDQRTRTLAAAPSYQYPLLTFEKLLAISKRESTIEEALEELAKKYPTYLLTHTHVYATHSIQASSFVEPRTIVFGPDAKFVFTFNGSSKYEGGGSFETMEYDEDQGQFLFREIAFKKQIRDDERELIFAELDSQNENVAWTKANPGRCTQCHGENPSPIWETYFIWPGSYGSNDDLLTTTFHRSEMKENPNYKAFGVDNQYGISQGREFKLKKGVKDVEVEGFKAFLSAKKAHPRYKHIPDRGLDKGYLRWLAGENPAKIDVSQDVAKDVEMASPGNHPGQYGRPNLNLNDLLYVLTGKKFIKQMAAQKKTATLPLKIALLDGCLGESRYIPAEFGKAVPLADYVRYWATDPFRGTEGILTDEEIKSIRQASGPWKEFYKRYLIMEISVEGEKISRLEDSFGGHSLISTHLTTGAVAGRPSAEFYKTIGHEVTRFERLVTGAETDDLFGEAFHDYVARGFGVDLTEYATNLRRVASFREGGTRRMVRSLFAQLKIDETTAQIPEKCEALKKALAAAESKP